ncbi:MAG: hypothetical protein M3131_04250 [Actinomycetota bacterium]|nr:hypothetical protein [Actinomycetota bacterium]
MKQPIGSRLHGALDYLTGVSLLGGSRLPALRGRFAGYALLAAGANHLAYSLLTDYELGVVRKLPYRLHLVLDAAGALGLVAAGATRSDAVDRFVPIGVGLYELGAVVLSDPGGGRRIARQAVTVNRSEAEVRAFLSDAANVRAFSPDGSWPGKFELRPAPGGRGTEIHADAEPSDLRRASQLLEAGELATAEGGPAGRRGPLSAVLPSLDTGADAA